MSNLFLCSWALFSTGLMKFGIFNGSQIFLFILAAWSSPHLVVAEEHLSWGVISGHGAYSLSVRPARSLDCLGQVVELSVRGLAVSNAPASEGADIHTELIESMHPDRFVVGFRCRILAASWNPDSKSGLCVVCGDVVEVTCDDRDSELVFPSLVVVALHVVHQTEELPSEALLVQLVAFSQCPGG